MGKKESEEPKGPNATRTCSICGKVITKRKSFLVRAGAPVCRDHPGVGDLMLQIQHMETSPEHTTKDIEKLIAEFRKGFKKVKCCICKKENERRLLADCGYNRFCCWDHKGVNLMARNEPPEEKPK